MPPFARRNKKLPECVSDHTQIGSCRSPAPARQMANPNFSERAASGVEPVEQLGVDHRSACFKRMALEKIDGESAIGSPLGRMLLAVGFREGPRRLTLSA